MLPSLSKATINLVRRGCVIEMICCLLSQDSETEPLFFVATHMDASGEMEKCTCDRLATVTNI